MDVFKPCLKGQMEAICSLMSHALDHNLTGLSLIIDLIKINTGESTDNWLVFRVIIICLHNDC